MTKRLKSRFAAAPMGVEIASPPGMEEMTSQLQSCSRTSDVEAETAPLKIKDAMKLLD